MDNTSPQIKEEQADNIIRILRMMRLIFIILFATLGPILYMFKVVSDNTFIWVCIGLAFLAVIDWYSISHIIQKIENAKEQIR